MSEGLLLAQRFQLLAKLGKGGMGSVWRAADLILGVQVAIKLIDSGIETVPEALGRFKREAQAAAALRSANVVQILDFGVDQGRPFIDMELLKGERLGARLRCVGGLSARETAQILSQVANALARAHDLGIVPRDLKPENILLVRDGADKIAKVLDFGIAKQTDVLSDATGVKTSTGALLGTPFYMSPEQALGLPDVDHRVDLWSYGVIAYECITGTRPFKKDTLGTLLMTICNETPLPPSCVAAVLRAATGTEDPGESNGSDGVCATRTNGPRGTGPVLNATKSCRSYWGAEDMVGNLWEWTADWFAAVGSGSGADPTSCRDARWRLGEWYCGRGLCVCGAQHSLSGCGSLHRIPLRGDALSRCR